MQIVVLGTMARGVKSLTPMVIDITDDYSIVVLQVWKFVAKIYGKSTETISQRRIFNNLKFLNFAKLLLSIGVTVMDGL